VLLALALPATPVGAQATTDVYAVHGLNLDGQSSPDAGGTAVTVCAGTNEIAADFQFGDVIGPLALPTGAEVSLQVYVGAEDCATADPAAALIDQAVTPTGTAVALVATSFGDQLSPELLPIPLDLSCVDPGSGGAVAVHAANAPEVDVVNTTLGVSVGTISYGEQIAGQLPVGSYDVEVYIVGGSPDPVMAFPITTSEGATTIGYAVGNQPGEGSTPLVIIPQVIDVGTCAPATTTTTEPPGAAAAATQPSFTG
jgi:hypothetical protein